MAMLEIAFIVFCLLLLACFAVFVFIAELSRFLEFKEAKENLKKYREEFVDRVLKTVNESKLSRAKDPDGRRWLIHDEEDEYEIILRFIRKSNSTSCSDSSRGFVPGSVGDLSLMFMANWSLVAPVKSIHLYKKEDFDHRLRTCARLAVDDFFENHTVAVHNGRIGKGGELAHSTYDPKIGDEYGRIGDEYKKYYKPDLINWDHLLGILRRNELIQLINDHVLSFNADKDYYEKIRMEAERNEEAWEILEKLDELTCGFYREGGRFGFEYENAKSDKLKKAGFKGGLISSTGFATNEFIVAG